MPLTEQELKSTLDDLILEFFITLDKLNDSQILLNNEMEAGFMAMSRSRYKMGVKAVDIACFNADKLSASHRVAMDNNGLSLCETCDRESELATDIEGTGSVRRRGVLSKSVPDRNNDEIGTISQDFNKLTTKNDSDVETENGDKPIRRVSEANKNNPLNFFGILVPQSLRDCQSNFVKAVELSVEVADVKMTLASVQQQYMQLCTQLRQCDTPVKQL